MLFYRTVQEQVDEVGGIRSVCQWRVGRKHSILTRQRQAELAVVTTAGSSKSAPSTPGY